MTRDFMGFTWLMDFVFLLLLILMDCVYPVIFLVTGTELESLLLVFGLSIPIVFRTYLIRSFNGLHCDIFSICNRHFYAVVTLYHQNVQEIKINPEAPGAILT